MSFVVFVREGLIRNDDRQGYWPTSKMMPGSVEVSMLAEKSFVYLVRGSLIINKDFVSIVRESLIINDIGQAR